MRGYAIFAAVINACGAAINLPPYPLGLAVAPYTDNWIVAAVCGGFAIGWALFAWAVAE